jgi:prepilin-type N-terminal cleavage/methylation domain-containing protein
MNNKFKEIQRKSEEGFTLIELLVVIVIIGVLAAIALPIFLNQQKAAADAALKSDMRNVALTYQTWKVKNPTGPYPDYFINWINAAGDTPLNDTTSNFSLTAPVSTGTRLHAFDYGVYNAGIFGQRFCIEGANSGGNYSGILAETGSRLYFSSAKGGFSSSC